MYNIVQINATEIFRLVSVRENAYFICMYNVHMQKEQRQNLD